METSPISGERVVLRPATLDDVDVLTAVLHAPSVAAWWPDENRDTVAGYVTNDEEHTYAIELDGTIVGLIQWWEEDDPQYRHGGIDLALAPAAQGQGLGTDAVRAMARFLVDVRGHHRVTIDPAVANAAAIRCYEKVGFRAVGVMRAYERGANGTFHDGLLMDLLASELTA